MLVYWAAFWQKDKPHYVQVKLSPEEQSCLDKTNAMIKRADEAWVEMLEMSNRFDNEELRGMFEKQANEFHEQQLVNAALAYEACLAAIRTEKP